MSKTNSLIWQRPGWPHLTANADGVTAALLKTRQIQGEVIGKAKVIGFDQKGEAAREILFREVMATSAIEGELLDAASVRSSVLRKLGMESPTGAMGGRHIDGLVDVIQDALTGFDQRLDEDRLMRWQSALFPGGTSGIRRIAVGRYRDHQDDMQIVSGALGKEVVHYIAPPSHRVKQEMDAFLQWFADTRPSGGTSSEIDGILRSAIAHFWFESIHPFEDGNGRIGRAIIDMAMAQDLGTPTRLYSLSSQLLINRRGYYDALGEAQHGSSDVSEWVQWFANVFCDACRASIALIDGAIEKARFWASHSQTGLNERQRKVVQRLLDDGDGGFLGGLNAEKYTKMTGASKPTATRDMAELVRNGMLRTDGLGKAMRYYVVVPGWTHGVKSESMD